MSKLAGLAQGPVIGVAGAAAAVAVGAGLYLGGVFDRAKAPEASQEVAMVAPEAVPEPAPKPDLPQAQPTPAMPDLPKVSTFRLDPDGQMLVAGRSEPGWQTAIRLDNDVLSRFMSEANGEFVEFVMVPPSDTPRVLSLAMTSPETGEEVESRSDIIIAPLRAPVVAEDEVKSEAQDIVKKETSEEEPAKEEVVPSAVLLSDETRVRVIQPAPAADASPEVMSVVALDAISYSGEGEVSLEGRAANQGFVRVYLDNAPITTSRIEADGRWRSELPEVDTGVYTLRIDEVNAAGEVTSRVETPFKREDQAVLAEASEGGALIEAVTVQPGYTLWGISRENYGDGLMYVRIFEANKDRIRNPDLIYPGQVFNIPGE